MNPQRSGCLVAALVVSLLLLGVSAVMNLMLAGGSGTAVGSGGVQKFEETLVNPAAEKGDSDKILLIHLRGLISGFEPGAFGDTSIDDIKLQLRQAAGDENVKAVVLHIDSPGGEVTASDIIYNAVRKFRDEKKKPVVVCMGSLAASGGYYVACGASHIIANETTFTGSIGVIMESFKYKALFDKVGVEFVTFKSGKMKDMLSGARDMTDEEKEYVQKMIMQTYDKFVGIVAKERKLPVDDLRNGVADGRVISGKDALEAKLVDQVGEIEDAYAKAAALGQAKNARVVRYVAPYGFGRFLRLLGQADGEKQVRVELPGAMAPRLEPGKAYYLPSYLVP
ncbi:MAG: signal peptide peptidase SppA [Chthoniobacteraceae bacterium]